MDTDISSPPSYNDTVNLNFFAGSRTHAQRFTDQITGTRSRHIYSIITTEILPIVQSRAEAGLSRTVITLLPAPTITIASTSEDDQTHSRPLTISLTTSNDFDDDLTIHQVYLSSSTDSPAFWSQKSVVDELRSTLGKSLSISSPSPKAERENSSSLDINTKESQQATTHQQQQQQLQQTSPPPHSSNQANAPTQPRSKGFFFSRRTSSRNTPVPPPPTPPASSITNTNTNTNDLDQKQTGTFVSVSLEEVMARTQTPFGLYETKSKIAVVVRVKIQE